MPWHRWLAVSLSLQFWVQSLGHSSGICGKQSGSGTGFSPDISVFLPVIIPPMLHTHYRVLAVYTRMDSRMHFGIWYLRSENNVLYDEKKSVTCSHLYCF